MSFLIHLFFNSIHMKKTLAGLLVLMAATGFAQTTEEPVLMENLYFLDISPNGKYATSQTANLVLYNLNNGDAYAHEAEIGLGHSVADNGMAVGFNIGLGVVINKEKMFTPKLLSSYSMSSINSISGDGKRVTGYLSNPKAGNNGGDYTLGQEVPLIPYVADLDEKGDFITITELPFPSKDFFGMRPMYVLGLDISDDGKTILAEMVDSFGRLCDPIVYKETADGEWKFFTPTLPLFNPDKVEIPENPWDNMKEPPEYVDYMDSDQWENYQNDLWDYLMGEIELYPEPEDYMTQEQMDDYENAMKEYAEYYESHQQDLRDFDRAYIQVLQNSPSFGFNEMTLSRDGKHFACIASYFSDDDYDEPLGELYLFSLTGDPEDEITGGYSYQAYNPPHRNLMPTQILSDGTFVVSSRMTSITTTSFMLLPDNENFITVDEYFESTHPGYAEWMNTEIPHGNGVVSMSEDKATFLGALQPEHYADIDETSAYSSFIFSDNAIHMGAPNYEPDNTGIQTLVSSPQDGTYSVFNLQGVNVLNTKDADEIRNLNSGIYIVNGRKILIGK